MAPADHEIIHGIHPVIEALKQHPERISEIVVQKSRTGAKITELIELAKQNNCRLRFTPRLEDFGKNSDPARQGVLARLSPVPAIDLDQLLAKARASAAPLLLVLDSIQDPHNLGAIIRSAAAAGADGIILPKDRCAPLSAVAVKASAGAVAHMKICRVTNLARALDQVKEAGFWIYGTDVRAEQSIYQTDLAGAVCLVVGSEGKGIRPLIREQCDFLISIPMPGPLESLNASVAAGVILFERVRQVTAADKPGRQ